MVTITQVQGSHVAFGKGGCSGSPERDLDSAMVSDSGERCRESFLMIGPITGRNEVPLSTLEPSDSFEAAASLDAAGAVASACGLPEATVTRASHQPETAPL
mmetsp:Transcript_33151/g.84691  ORF Transcript_33151/g.84691 Transcript_33151/m.84691 type:complete len:102 (-) Transcript_33151:151-456(-)